MNHQRNGVRIARMSLFAIASMVLAIAILSSEFLSEIANALLNGWLRSFDVRYRDLILWHRPSNGLGFEIS